MKRKLILIAIFCGLVGLATTTQFNVTTQIQGILARVNGGTGVNSTATFPTSGTVTVTIATGTKALGVVAIGAGACAAAATAVATGTLTTDSIDWSFNTDPGAIAGYSTGRLGIRSYVAANLVGFRVCNSSTASITPGAATLNWTVDR
jgi:hypothetical protein